MESETASSNHVIEGVSAWILRCGVAASVVVMVIGMIFSFVHGHASLERMKSDPFDANPMTILRGIAALHGKSMIEAGVYLLLLTPISRIGASLVLFASKQHDWIYAFFTLIVLVLTLAGLLWLG